MSTYNVWVNRTSGSLYRTVERVEERELAGRVVMNGWGGRMKISRLSACFVGIVFRLGALL